MNAYKKIELLSPAGSLEALYAAVQNGCDAVYVGGKDFSARQYASNFSKEDLEKAIVYCHLRGIKLYLTVNTLYKEEEMNPFLYFIDKMYKLGIDAVIMQDLGAAMKVKELFPDIELHGSTQMNIHHIDGVRFLQSIGFKRIVLSRELHLGEIKDIITNTDMEVECFIHGALCVCYSGQCLMSSMLGGRSGNRGRCAQPCRLPYKLLQDANPIAEKEGTYLLSPKDIQTLTILPKLIEAGIHSFKIEGRMKRPEYVAAVTSIYRKYIDLYLQDQENYTVHEKDMKILTQLFNRGGFSEGYALETSKNSGRQMMSFKKPKNWGLYLGKVTQYNKRSKKCTIKTEEDLGPGDGIEIWTQNEPHPGTAISRNSMKGDIINISIDGNIAPGDAVYKTKDKQMIDELRRGFEKDFRKRSIYGHLKAMENLPLSLTVWDEDGNCIEELGYPVEKAKKQPICTDQLKQQLSKTGNTPFEFKELSIENNKDIYIPIGQINELRRKTLDKLGQVILSKHNNRKDIRSIFSNERLEPLEIKNKYLTILVQNADQIVPILDSNVKRIYGEINGFSIEAIGRSVELCHQHQIEFFIALPMIHRMYNERINEEHYDKLENMGIDGYLIRTYGQAYQTQNTTKKRVIDYTLNIFNYETINIWNDLRMNGITLSPELNIQEIKQMGGYNQEIVIYGNLPLMITEQCPIGNTIGKKNNHHFCAVKNDKKDYNLQDRIGERFFLQPDCSQCVCKIYNGKTLFLLEYMEELLSMPIDHMRLQFTIESPQEMKDILHSYINTIYHSSTLTHPVHKTIQAMKNKGYTKGHYFRGVE